MTLQDLKGQATEVLTPDTVARVLGCDPNYIRVAARENKLPFPVWRSGNRTKIPKQAFIRWMEGGREKEPLP